MQVEKLVRISSVIKENLILCAENGFIMIYHQFLKQLIADAKGQKIHVIADNLRGTIASH